MLYKAWFRAAQIQCFHKITIAKIACSLCNFKNPAIGGWLRLPDCTQYKMRRGDEVTFYLCSTRYAWKVMQIKWGKRDKIKTKILRPVLIIIIWQNCEATVTNSWLRKLKACCLHFVKVKYLTSPIIIAIMTKLWLWKLKECWLHFVKVKNITFPIMKEPVHL